MKSCGSILIGGAIVLGIGLVATGSTENSANFFTVLVVMAVIGFVISRSSKKGPAPSKAADAQRRPRPDLRDPRQPPGWSLTQRADSLAQEWKGNHSVLPSTGIWNVRSGRAHRRQVHVFQSARTSPAPTFMIFRMPDYNGPLFEAVSDGRNEVNVRGSMPPGGSELLSRIGPRNFRRLGVLPGKLFWMDVGTLGETQVATFVVSRVPSIVETVNEHLPTGKPAQQSSRQPSRQPSRQRPTQQRPTQQRPAQQRPAQQHPRPAALPASKLPHDFGPNPDDILRTAPIELTERPALKPAAADPVSASLENPELSTAWKPIEWTPAPFALTAPMGLGETPSAVEELATGWKPREWTPPTYGQQGVGEWKPAAAWQPNYSTTGED